MADPRYLKLLDEMKELHARKSAGYGRDRDAWANFRESEALGIAPPIGALVRFMDKVARIKSLMRDRSNDQVGESLRDTLMDAAAYALIAVCLFEEVEADPPIIETYGTFSLP